MSHRRNQIQNKQGILSRGSTSQPVLPSISNQPNSGISRLTAPEKVSQRLKKLNIRTPLPAELPTDNVRERVSQIQERIDRTKAGTVDVKSRDVSHKLDSIKKLRGESDLYKTELLELLGYKEKKSLQLPKTTDYVRSVITSPINFPKSISIPSPKEKYEKTKNLNKAEDLKHILGAPAGRRDAEKLQDWLDEMISKMLSEDEENLDHKFVNAQKIYTICFEEIVRQVSVHCVERGHLIKTVWEGYLGLLEQAFRIAKKKEGQLLEETEFEKNKIKFQYEGEIRNLQRQIEKLNQQESRTKHAATVMEHIIKQKDEKEQKFLQRIEVIQKHYEDTKKKLLYVREDNRVLKIRMENEQSEYSEDEFGNLVPKNRVKKGYKHRTCADIEKEMMQDPIIKISQIMEDQEGAQLVEQMQKHEKEQEDRLSADDFQDKSTDTSDFKSGTDAVTEIDMDEVLPECEGEPSEGNEYIQRIMDEHAQLVEKQKQANLQQFDALGLNKSGLKINTKTHSRKSNHGNRRTSMPHFLDGFRQTTEMPMGFRQITNMPIQFGDSTFMPERYGTEDYETQDANTSPFLFEHYGGEAAQQAAGDMTDRLQKIEALLDQIDHLSINLKIEDGEKLVARKATIQNDLQNIKDENTQREQVSSVFANLTSDFGAILKGIKNDMNGIKKIKNEAKYEISTQISQIQDQMNRHQQYMGIPISKRSRRRGSFSGRNAPQPNHRYKRSNSGEKKNTASPSNMRGRRESIKKGPLASPQKQAELDQNKNEQVRFFARKVTEFAEFKLGQARQSKLVVKKEKSHPCHAILAKVKGAIANKMKITMVKKMVLKMITSLYSERLALSRALESNRSIEFASFIYDFNMKKYGLKKVSEQKFTQLVASCIKHNECLRINIFGRFLGLYQPLDNDSLNLYLDCLDYLDKKNNVGMPIPSNDYDEKVFIPIQRALDCAKYIFESKLSVDEYFAFKFQIESQKQPDPKKINKQGIIQIDKFLIDVIEKDRIEKSRQRNFVKILFNAADLNGDGYLQYDECKLLFDHLSKEDFTEERFKVLFNSSSDLYAIDNELASTERAISFDKFVSLVLSYDIFTMKTLEQFAQITHPDGLEWHLRQIRQELGSQFALFRWRFAKYEQDLFAETLESLHMSIIKGTDAKPTWIAYRLMEEESKKMAIEGEVKSFCPDFVFTDALKIIDFKKQQSEEEALFSEDEDQSMNRTDLDVSNS